MKLNARKDFRCKNSLAAAVASFQRTILTAHTNTHAHTYLFFGFVLIFY